MTHDELKDAVRHEIVGLHVEFERWFRGVSQSLEPVEAALAPGFTIVSPQGSVVDRPTLMAALQGSERPREIAIRIEDVVVRRDSPESVLATYTEWHDLPAFTTTRQSSVLFSRTESGLQWEHVHETWRTPPPQ